MRIQHLLIFSSSSKASHLRLTWNIETWLPRFALLKARLSLSRWPHLKNVRRCKQEVISALRYLAVAFAFILGAFTAGRRGSIRERAWISIIIADGFFFPRWQHNTNNGLPLQSSDEMDPAEFPQVSGVGAGGWKCSNQKLFKTKAQRPWTQPKPLNKVGLLLSVADECAGGGEDVWKAPLRRKSCSSAWMKCLEESSVLTFYPH